MADRMEKAWLAMGVADKAGEGRGLGKRVVRGVAVRGMANEGHGPQKRWLVGAWLIEGVWARGVAHRIEAGEGRGLQKICLTRGVADEGLGQ